MRSLFARALMLTALFASPALANEAEAKPSLLDPAGGLMFWTLVVFLVLFFVLSKFAFGPIVGAVEAREQALRDAMEEAKADREAAAKALAEQQAKLDAARSEAQQVIAEGRATAEKMKSDIVEAAKGQATELLERAKRDIEAEKVNAVAALRREAVDLAIAGAAKVIEKNLDDAQNRTLVENYLSSIGTK